MSKIVGKGRKTWKDGSVMTYTITDDGVLTISGCLCHGMRVPMQATVPFRHLVIAEGVTFIGSENFSDMEQLEELTLSSSIGSIGDNAFNGCGNLSIIHFSDGLKTIGKRAFAHCGNLKRLRLPGTLNSVGKDSFYKCSSLSKVSLPRSLKAIGDGMFAHCTSLEEIKIPGGVETIQSSAFYCCENLKTVSLPRGLKIIGDSAFRCCSVLETISIPPSVEAIESSAFMSCDKLRDVFLPNDNIKLTSGKWTASFCKDVKCFVTGEDGNEYECTITNVITDRNDVMIKPSGKLSGDVIVPSHVEYEGKSYPVTVIDREAFYGMKIKSLVLPDTVVVIQDSAFGNCDRLRDVDLGKNLKKIGNSAFEWCENLRYMPMPASVRQVGYHALHKTVLTDNSWEWGVLYFGHILYGYHGDLPEHSYIEVREGTTVIADGAFNSRFEPLKDYNNLEGVVLPSGIKRIGDGAFEYCKGLSYVSVPKSVEYIGRYSFSENVKIVSAPRRRPPKTQLVEPSPKDVVCIEETKRYTLDESGVLTIKKDMTLIKDEEFKGRSDIKKVIIPGTVEFIGNSSFSGCRSLTGVVMKEGVRVIWENAFSGCSKLKRIHLPASMETICSSAFSCCKGLQEAVVPSNVHIDKYAFSGCDSLKKVIIRDIHPMTTENH